jgi:hypothetical protein
MLLSLLYFALCRILRLLTGGGNPDDAARDLEILVLRHQLHVLERDRRPRLGRRDRILLAAASRFLPRERWRCFPVSPTTLLRWHRDLVRRKWTHRGKRQPGRPRVTNQVVSLVLRLAKENPRWGYVRIGGRTEEGRHLRLGSHHPLAPSPPWTYPSSTARGSFLERVSLRAGRRHLGLRLLLRGDHWAENPLCSLLH